jgi:hypothetical protein
MGLVSTFYAGSAKEVAAALRERAAAADYEFSSLHTSALFQPGIDAACRELVRMRGKRPSGLKRYIAEVLDGDREESQVVRLDPAFVTTFGTLTNVEAVEISRRLAEKEQEEDGAFRQRQLEAVSRPFQSKRDLLALVLMPIFAWHMSLRSGTSPRAAVLVGSAAGVAFLALTIVVLPWARRRKVPPARAARDDHAPTLNELAGLCRRAERAGLGAAGLGHGRRPSGARVERDDHLVQLLERLAHRPRAPGLDTGVERFLRRVEVAQDEQRLAVLLFEGDRRDGAPVTPFVVRPDEARVRRHVEVATEERHRP